MSLGSTTLARPIRDLRVTSVWPPADPGLPTPTSSVGSDLARSSLSASASCYGRAGSRVGLAIVVCRTRRSVNVGLNAWVTLPVEWE